MSRRATRLVVVSGIICLTGLGSGLAADTFDGVYTGRRVSKGGPSSECAAEVKVSVVIRSDTLKFTVGDRPSIVIGFSPRPDGSFRLMSAGIAGPAVFINGRIIGDVIDADVTNAPCEFHWQLTKEPSRQ